MSAVVLSSDELERITRSGGWRTGRIEVFDTAGGPVLVKGQRPPRHPLRYQVLNALARLLGVPFLKAAPMHGGARAQQIELARLRALAAAGARVPRVLHAAPDHFVMQWLGDANLSALLHGAHPQGAALWRAGGDELARVHAHDQYLSQGFARNLIVDTHAQPPRLAGAIDFEDDPAEVMSVPEAQVRDWLAFLQSTLWTLALPADEVDAQLDAWLAAEPSPVRALFLRAGRRLGWLRHLPQRRRFGRDTVALQAAAAAAHRFSQRHGTSSATGQAS